MDIIKFKSFHDYTITHENPRMFGCTCTETIFATKQAEEFLIEKVFYEDEIKLVYSHIDRIITGSATPVNKELKLEAGSELRAKYFLERREMGVINIGGDG
mgnify:CR=1 FL=1